MASTRSTRSRPACSPAAARERVSACSGGSGFRSGTTRSTCRARRSARVLDGLAEFREHLGGDLTVTLLCRHRPGRRGARDATSRLRRAAPSRAAPPTRPTVKLAARASPSHLLHQHPPRRDLGRGAREPRRHVRAVKAAVAPDPALRRRPPALGGGARDAGARPRCWKRSAASRRRAVSTSSRSTAFPYGPFHGTRVKEEVYLPDWLDDERLALLATVWPRSSPRSCRRPGLEGASAPCRAPSSRASAARGRERMADLCPARGRPSGLRERTGRTIALALEPEPCCPVETIAETVRFFEEDLFSRGVRGARWAA